MSTIGFVTVLLFSSLAAAQDREPRLSESALKIEYAAIQSESANATGLYVASLSLVLGGGGVFGLGFATISVLGIGALVFWGLGVIAAAIGVILFIPAVVVDVSSGVRRGRYQRQLDMQMGVGSSGLSVGRF